MSDWHGGRRLRARHAKIDKQRRNFSQGGLDREVGGNMAHFREGAEPRLGRPLSGKGQRRVLRADPLQKRAAFFRVGRDETDPGGRGQKRDRRRVDDLKNIEAKSVGD